MRTHITRKNLDVLNAILRLGADASVRTVGAAVGLSSTASVVAHFNKLYAEGLIDYRHRSVTATGKEYKSGPYVTIKGKQSQCINEFTCPSCGGFIDKPGFDPANLDAAFGVQPKNQVCVLIQTRTRRISRQTLPRHSVRCG